MSKKDKYLMKIHSLFNEYGVKGLTMDDIAKRIGVTKMTLYNNFKDKDALVEEIIRMRSHCYMSYMQCIDAEKLNAIQVLIHVLQFQRENPLPSSRLFYETFQEVYPQLYEMQQRNFKDALMRFVKSNIEQGQREGIFRDDISSDSISTYTIATMDNMFRNWVNRNADINLNNLHVQIIDYHIRGIANEKGLKVLEQELRKITENEGRL